MTTQAVIFRLFLFLLRYCYGYCNGQAAAVRPVYQAWFPDRREPDHNGFSKVCRRESDTIQRRSVSASEDEEQIFCYCGKDSRIST